MKFVKMKSDLAEKGYAVVEGVYNAEECAALHAGFWDTFGALSGVVEEDKSTWANVYKLLPNHGMLVQHFKVGHMQQIWDARQHKNVHKVFKRIWDTPNLTVSFDGCAFGMQPEITGRGWQRNGWLHLGMLQLFISDTCFVF